MQNTKEHRNSLMKIGKYKLPSDCTLLSFIVSTLSAKIKVQKIISFYLNETQI